MVEWADAVCELYWAIYPKKRHFIHLLISLNWFSLSPRPSITFLLPSIYLMYIHCNFFGADQDCAGSSGGIRRRQRCCTVAWIETTLLFIEVLVLEFTGREQGDVAWWLNIGSPTPSWLISDGTICALIPPSVRFWSENSFTMLVLLAASSQRQNF